MSDEPIKDSRNQSPPKPLIERPAFVKPNALTTYRFMADLPDAGGDRWFVEAGGMAPHQKGTEGNEVKYLVDGEEAFEEMLRAIRTAKGGKYDFIYLLGWWLSIDFPLSKADPDSTIRKLFQAASDNGVQVRAMLWRHKGPDEIKAAVLKHLPLLVGPLPALFFIPSLGFDKLGHNVAEVKFINTLRNGAAILDDATRAFGAHHQKALIVGGEEGLIAFCGGIDLNPDRIDAKAEGALRGAPMHDVHCRIQGPATEDVLQNFVTRWTSHFDHILLDQEKGDLVGKKLLKWLETHPFPPRSTPGVAQRVQVGRTYGKGYPILGGIQEIRAMILNAIDKAERFIYIEDQYLVNIEVANHLAQALQRGVKHVTILIPDTVLCSDLPQVHQRRTKFLNALTVGGDRARLFVRKPPGNEHTYVHSKMYIMDDKLAIIGSANCNRRGLQHDTEIDAAIFDASSKTKPALHFAHRLRIRLWAEHLNMDTPSGHAELIDGVASAIHWLNPPSGARIERRVITYSSLQTSYDEDLLWDGVFDPAD